MAQRGLSANIVLRSKSEIALRNIVVIFLSVCLLIFSLIPIGIAFAGSFHQWNPLNQTYRFIGFANYMRLFSYPVFWKAMTNTVVFCVVVIIFRVLLGLALAYAVSSVLIKYKTFFRTVLYMPTVTPLVAVAYVWKLMYQPQFGFINNITGLSIDWLLDKNYALGAIMLMTVWKDFGYAVIMYMAGLMSVSNDCLEAASIDGASNWQRFKYVTLPFLRPTTQFVVITSLISYLQTYVQVMVLTKGGPGTETFLSSYIVYDQAFVKYNFGFASAIAFIILICTAALTVVSFRVSREK